MPDYAYKSYTAKKLRDKRPAIFDELINSKRNILYQTALLLLSFLLRRTLQRSVR
jgi:hypothetical protein